MPKFTLSPSPTFKAPVEISVPGQAKKGEVVFTFRHRSTEELKAWWDAFDSKQPVERVMEMVSGWDLEDAFTAENVDGLLKGYHSAAGAILKTYLEQLSGVRLGN